MLPHDLSHTLSYGLSHDTSGDPSSELTADKISPEFPLPSINILKGRTRLAFNVSDHDLPSHDQHDLSDDVSDHVSPAASRGNATYLSIRARPEFSLQYPTAIHLATIDTIYLMIYLMIYLTIYLMVQFT